LGLGLRPEPLGLLETRAAQAVVELLFQLFANGLIDLDFAAPAAQAAARELDAAVLTGLWARHE
jgi:hypothetical protein